MEDASLLDRVEYKQYVGPYDSPIVETAVFTRVE